MIRQAAKWNKLKFPEDLELDLELDMTLVVKGTEDDEDKKMKDNGSLLTNNGKCNNKNEDDHIEVHRSGTLRQKDNVEYTLIDVFRYPKLRRYSLMMCFMW